jgi:hypothetical protein
MNKTLIALAAAAVALALTPAAQAGFTVPSVSAKPLVQKVCDGEDRAEFAEERAEARVEALEDGEGSVPRQASIAPQSSPRRVAAEPEQTPASKSTADAGDKKGDDQKVATTETAKVETKKADEPKKSVTKSVASAEPGSCKKFFPSVGMTLSVPCE